MSDSTTVLLLEKWKKAKGLETDYQAAKALRTKPQTVSNWRRGENHMSVVFAEKIASDLRLDVLQVLAALEADRAIKTPETQAVWRRYGKAAFMTLLVGFALPGALPSGLQTATANASTTLQTVADQSHYAKSRRWPFKDRPRRRSGTAGGLRPRWHRLTATPLHCTLESLKAVA